MLRVATPDDIPQIQAVLNTPANWDKLEAYPDAAVLGAITGDEDRVFVWDEHGSWSGFCWLKLVDGAVKIEEFGAAKPGQGIGSKLFSAVLDWAENEGGVSKIWLAVAADNSNAIRFYERFGFVRSDLREKAWTRRAGPVADALIMQRAL